MYLISREKYRALFIILFVAISLCLASSYGYAATVTDTCPECANEEHCTEYKNIADVISNLNQTGTIDGVKINKYTPVRTYDNGSRDNAALGCAPVAMGTAENFFLKPEGYFLAHGQVNDDFARLLANHGVVSEWFPRVNPNVPNTNYFAPNGQTGFPTEVLLKKVMGVFGYDVQQRDFSRADGKTDRQRATDLYEYAKSEINQGRPVLLSINHKLVTGQHDHVIVITGYKKHSWEAVPLTGIRREDIFLYALMGWGGNENGWWQVDKKHFVIGGQTYNLDNVHVYTLKPKPEGNYDKKLADVATDHWAYPYIRQLYESGLINGYLLNNQRIYLPEAEMTRYETLTLIFRVAGLAVDMKWAKEDLGFKDLKNNRDIQMQAIIGTAIEKGIVAPYKEGENEYFRPRDDVTRGEFAKVLIRALNAKGRGFSKVRTYPGEAGLELEGYLKTLYEARVLDGYQGQAGSPPDLRVAGKVKRSEAAKIVRNAIK